MSKSPRTILVVGASGFVGRAAFEHLSRQAEADGAQSELRAFGASRRFTIWRSPMNPIAPLVTYAVIAKHVGKPLCWPGGRTGPTDTMDARLLARALS